MFAYARPQVTHQFAEWITMFQLRARQKKVMLNTTYILSTNSKKKQEMYSESGPIPH